MKGFSDSPKSKHSGIEHVDASSPTDSTEELIKEGMTLRQRLARILHSRKAQIIVIILIVVDCLFVLGELLIDLKAFEGKAEKLPLCRNESEHSEGEVHSEHEDPEIIAGEVLHYCSIAILSIFLIELCLKLFAMGKEFFHHRMEIIDGVVIIISFALDVAFAGDERLSGFIGLLVLTRLWRVTRIVNGVILSVKTQLEKKLVEERRLRETAEEELRKYSEFCREQEQQIDALQLLLTNHDITYQKMKREPPSAPKLDVVAEVNRYISDTQKLDADLSDVKVTDTNPATDPVTDSNSPNS